MESINIVVEDTQRLVSRIKQSAQSRALRWGEVPNAPSASVGQGFGDVGNRLEAAVERLRELGTEGASRFDRHGEALSGLLRSVGQTDDTSADLLRRMISNDRTSR